MQIVLDPNSLDDYATFLKIKSLPSYRICGRQAEFPDEYAARLGIQPAVNEKGRHYKPHPRAFDYQAAISETAIDKRKYCLFIDCGYGKTLIFLEWAQHAIRLLPKPKCALIVSPLMVVPQTIKECETFYGKTIKQVHSNELDDWLVHGTDRIGITNYEAFSKPIRRGRLGALVIDESSMLKSHYGKWGTSILELGKGLDWKLACTGTPAPNDRIEYANHAVFMDAYPTVNSFLARFFVNKGQTCERWMLKQHALEPFYRALSHWSIFMVNPATYGWHDHADDIPPIFVHEHDVELTSEQEQLGFRNQGFLIPTTTGGITSRSVLAQISNGNNRGVQIESHKPAFIRGLIETWPDESTIVWCRFNHEQARLEQEMPDAGSISGATKYDKRMEIINAFKAGDIKTIISKPKILGFGLNLQKATRQVFSSCHDSYESYYQAVKRSNRVGSIKPLNVHLPVTDIERPMMENVLRKARMVQQDTEEQERIFRRVL